MIFTAHDRYRRVSRFFHLLKYILAVAVLAIVVLQSSTARSLPDGVQAEAYATGLRFPVAMAPTPDGDVLVTEKGIDIDGGPEFPGAIRLIEDGQLVEEPVATFRVKTVNESGMLGIELMPDFSQSGEFLTVYTPRDDQAHMYVTRLRLRGDKSAEILEDPFIKLPSREGATRHFGGNLRARGQYIYISLSDVTQDHHPQDLSTLHGSILRYNLDGTVPEDNPFGSDNPIYAYGLRNCFDLDFDAEGRLYCGENGHTRHDHVNYIRKGRNYGWPWMLGYCDHYPVMERCKGKGFTEPAHEFSYRVGPTGMLMYEGSMFPEWEGHMFMGGWHTAEVHHLEVDNASGTDLYEHPSAFWVLPDGPFGFKNDAEREHLGQYGVTDVAEASDGAILVLESGVNRGTLYRIAPESQIIDPDNVVSMGDRRLKNAVIGNTACSSGGSDGTTTTGVLLMVALLLMARLLGRRHRLRRAGSLIAGVAVMGVMLTGDIESARAEGVQIEYGGMIGLDASTPSGENIYLGQMGIGTAASGILRIDFFRYVGAQAELGYSLKGSGLKRTSERLNLTYLTLPVSLYGQLPVGDVDIRLHAGASNNLLVRAAMSDGPPFTDQMKRHELGLFGGLGVDISTALPFDLIVDARYERGVTQLLDPDKKPAYIEAVDNAWTNTIYLFVGGLF